MGKIKSGIQTDGQVNGSAMDKFEKLLYQIERLFGRIKWNGKTIALDLSPLEGYSNYFRYGDGLDEIELKGKDKDNKKYLVKWVFDLKKFKWRVKEVKALDN